MSRAPYIALEGAEGSGKSTQAKLLAGTLGAVHTQETGGTAVGQRLRAVLHDNSVVDLDPRAEALIAAADRAQHLAEVVIPALEAGRPVVSDRSVYSTLAYQGYGRQLDLAELRRLNDWAMHGVWPDVVVFVEAPADVVADRLDQRTLDRFERAGDDFHARVLAGYRAMAAADPGRWLVVDTAAIGVDALGADAKASGDANGTRPSAAAGTIEAVAAAVLGGVVARLPELAK